MFELIYIGIVQGLILTLVSLGIMISFRLLNFPDLSPEGSYTLGGAVFASLMISGFSYITSLILAMVTAGCLSSLAAHIALKYRVNSLLAGIIVSTMAYSINLRIMGKPNLALFTLTSELAWMKVGLLVFICYISVGAYLKTDYGLRLRSVGLNQSFALRYGICTYRYTCFGLFVSGALCGLGGCLTVQMNQFMDIGIGVGIVVHGLASLMLGEVLIGHATIKKQLCAPFVGSIVYQQVHGFILFMGLAPSDLKLFTSIMLLALLSTPTRFPAGP